MSLAATQARRGRPRSEAADDAILEATLALLGERGYRGLTMAAVIERAAVSSATLYRRWTAKHELVAAALASLTPALVVTDTGSLAGDLEVFLQHYAHTLASREDFAEALLLEVRLDPDLDRALRVKFLDPRVAELRAIFGRAAERGELPSRPSIDAAISLILGPLYYRAIVLREPLTPAFLKGALKHALAGVLAYGGGAHGVPASEQAGRHPPP